MEEIIKIKLAGIFSIGGLLTISVQNITEIAQMVAAILAVFVALGTMRLTYIRTKKAKKNEDHI